MRYSFTPLILLFARHSANASSLLDSSSGLTPVAAPQPAYTGRSTENFNIPWFIEILRKTNRLAVYFHCDKLKEDEIDWSIDVEYEITLKSSDGKRITKKTDHQFTKNEGYGFPKLMNWDTLIKDYLIDDSITIEVTVKITKMHGISKKALKSFDKSNEKFSDVVLSVEDKKFFVLRKVSFFFNFKT
ncbi:MATH domain-containing protein [Caenorhabditis elegans]|uniref:MATH domain-containing protein n=1 Tax=Caenorhabditis elegans TaxID=6239 RepID=O16567_CAEEL|nr:MATH domain-containing protein [Caenorhabditis elegans]CCD61270.1 MATH domain-containing protein [Caenorhabditis elegans]|eukprot:NP_494164.1 MATH (meprin-associated Traf homology) domain containing [Caenorhabditis elegans]